MGPFRVIVTGVRGFRDDARLRAVLDAALSRRLPDVVILSGCGPGTGALAISYATERGLYLIPYPLDYEHHPFNAPERRNACPATDADAAVVVWDEREPRAAGQGRKSRRRSARATSHAHPTAHPPRR
jgi:hypothetical protein